MASSFEKNDIALSQNGSSPTGSFSNDPQMSMQVQLTPRSVSSIVEADDSYQQSSRSKDFESSSGSAASSLRKIQQRVSSQPVALSPQTIEDKLQQSTLTMSSSLSEAPKFMSSSINTTSLSPSTHSGKSFAIQTLSRLTINDQEASEGSPHSQKRSDSNSSINHQLLDLFGKTKRSSNDMRQAFSDDDQEQPEQSATSSLAESVGSIPSPACSMLLLNSVNDTQSVMEAANEIAEDTGPSLFRNSFSYHGSGDPMSRKTSMSTLNSEKLSYIEPDNLEESPKDILKRVEEKQQNEMASDDPCSPLAHHGAEEDCETQNYPVGIEEEAKISKCDLETLSPTRQHVSEKDSGVHAHMKANSPLATSSSAQKKELKYLFTPGKTRLRRVRFNIKKSTPKPRTLVFKSPSPASNNSDINCAVKIMVPSTTPFKHWNHHTSTRDQATDPIPCLLSQSRSRRCLTVAQANAIVFACTTLSALHFMLLNSNKNVFYAEGLGEMVIGGVVGGTVCGILQLYLCGVILR